MLSEEKKNQIEKDAWAAWEEDQKTNQHGVNPYAFVYGYLFAAEKALVLKEALEKIRSMLYANKESNLNTEIDIINTALTQYNKP